MGEPAGGRNAQQDIRREPHVPASAPKASLGWLQAIVYGLLALAALAPAVWRLSRPSLTQASDGQVVLRYMAWGNPSQLDVERYMIRLFNEKCQREGKNVRVELFMPPAGGYEQKLRLMLASGTAPDVIRTDHYWFPALVPKGSFRDLTDLANSDPELQPADFHPSAMAENYYRGRLYGLNVQFGGVLCFYNKDLFARAGLPDPYDLWKQGEWTWDRFEQAASALTERDSEGRVLRYGFVIPGAPGGGADLWAWALWVWGEGGALLSPDASSSLLDQPAAIAGLQRMRDLRYKLRVAPVQSEAAGSAFTFESGKVAMGFSFMGATSRYREIIRDFAWDIVPVPYNARLAYGVPTPMGPRIMERSGGGERLHPHQLVKGNQLVMSATCAHPQAAWEWIKFMVSRDTELMLNGDTLRRAVPTRQSVLTGGDYLRASKPPFNTDTIPFVLDHARELPIDATWPVWTVAARQFMDALFANETATAARVAPKAAEAANRALSQERQHMARYVGRQQ